jgi:hypothetical protein
MPRGVSRRSRRGEDTSGGGGSSGRDRSGGGAGAVLILLAAIAAAYANALGASFQFDDWEVIVRDPRVQGLAAWWDSMPGMRPLLKLSYALNHASGLGVVGFHAVNVGIHAIVALLVMTLADRLVQRSAPGVEGSSRGAIPGFAARPGFPLAAAPALRAPSPPNRGRDLRLGPLDGAQHRLRAREPPPRDRGRGRGIEAATVVAPRRFARRDGTRARP